MRKVILIICFIYSLSGYSQFWFNPMFHSLDTSVFNSSKKIQYGFEMGTGFSSYAGGMSSTYYNPYMTFKAGKKLFIQTGFSTQNFNIGGFSAVPSFGKSLTPNQSQSLVVNTSALYKVNNKLNIYTAMYGTFGQGSRLSVNNFFQNQQTFANDSKGVSFGLEYQLKENIKISGHFQYQKNSRYNPFDVRSNFLSPYYSPFYEGW